MSTPVKVLNDNSQAPVSAQKIVQVEVQEKDAMNAWKTIATSTVNSKEGFDLEVSDKRRVLVTEVDNPAFE